MNSLLQDSYISKLLTLEADAEYSKTTHYISTKQNSFHINSFFLFSKTFYDSKYYYILTFTWLIQVLRAQFGQPGKRVGVQISQIPRCIPALIQSSI